MSAGRHVLLFFFGSRLDTGVQAELAQIEASRALFDARQADFFGMSADAADEIKARLTESLPGIRFFRDADGVVGRLYEAQPLAPDQASPTRSRWVLLDPMLRVLGLMDHEPGITAHVLAIIEELLSMSRSRADNVAPVLCLEHVFEPEFYQRLVAAYHTGGSVTSGVLTEREAGRPTAISDVGFERLH